MINNNSQITLYSLKQVVPIEKLRFLLFAVNPFAVKNITHFVEREEFLEQNITEVSLRCISNTNMRFHFIVSEELREVGKLEVWLSLETIWLMQEFTESLSEFVW